MNRRNFLKLGGLGSAAIVLPLPTIGAFWPKSTPLPTKDNLDYMNFGEVPESVKAGLHSAWWALSDLTVQTNGMHRIMAGDTLLYQMAGSGVQRVMWPPDVDLLFPAEATFRILPEPKMFCAIFRAPEDQWFICSDNTMGRYVHLKPTPVGRRGGRS